MVRIEGFTDSKGAPAYNLRLSNARAESVEKWMVAKQSRTAAMIRQDGRRIAAWKSSFRNKIDGCSPSRRGSNVEMYVLNQECRCDCQ